MSAQTDRRDDIGVMTDVLVEDDVSRSAQTTAAYDSDGDSPRIGAAFSRLFGGAVVGKALGLVRELALAASFGTGTVASGLRAAQTGTLIPAQFATGEALSAGLVPLWARLAREEPLRANALLRAVSATLLVFSVAVTTLILLGARAWAGLLFPGFGAEATLLTTRLLQVMALGIPFYVQSAVFWYWEMAHGGYALAAARATLQNIGLISGIAAAFLTGNPIWLAWGFTLAYVLLCLASPLWLAHRGMLGRGGRVPWPLVRSALREFGRAIRPLIVLPFVFQAGIALERALASLIGVGAVASLDYAKVLVETGLALVALPLGLASLAELSRVSAGHANRRLVRLVPVLVALALPASIAIAINAETIVRVLFARGAFDADSVRVTAAILMGLGLGLWLQLTAYVLGKALSARSRNREMVRCTVAGIVVGAVVQLLTWRQLGPFALGLGASAGFAVQLVLFARALGLTGVLARGTARVLPASAVYALLAFVVPGARASVVTSALLFIALMVAVLVVAPDLRRQAAAVLERIVRSGRQAAGLKLGRMTVEGSES
jgi:putative peptidoglycan lipid II flippase